MKPRYLTYSRVFSIAFLDQLAANATQEMAEDERHAMGGALWNMVRKSRVPLVVGPVKRTKRPYPHPRYGQQMGTEITVRVPVRELGVRARSLGA